MELSEELTLDSCTSRPHAVEVARRAVLNSRQQHGNLVVLGDGDGIDITPGDLIEVTHSVMGYDRKQFIVVEVGSEYAANREFYIREYSAGIYTFNGGVIDSISDNTDLDRGYVAADQHGGLTAFQGEQGRHDLHWRQCVLGLT